MVRRKPKKPIAEAPSKANQYILALPFFAVCLLILVGALFPGRSTWGISFLSLADPLMAVTVVILGAIAVAPPVAARLAALLRPLFEQLTKLQGRINKPVLVILASIAVTVILFYWRSKSYLYGDGYIVLSDASSGDELELMGQKYLQLLTIYLNYSVYEGVTRIFSWSPENVMGLSNAIGGMVGLWALYRICGQLTHDNVTRAFIFLGALSSGTVVLFFGYIENYTWALSSGLWTLSLALGVIRKENGTVPLFVAATVSAALHMITLPFAVVAVMSALMKRGPDGNLIMGVPLKRVNAGLVVASVLVVVLAGALDIRIFVPFWPREGNPYSVFSADHIVDVINQIALVAPLGAAMVIMSWVYVKKSHRPYSPEAAIVGTSALLFFMEAVWINPELGAPRDWDLLAFYGLPLTLWGLYRFSSFFAESRVGRQWLVPAVAVAGIVLMPNLYEKNHPDVAAARLDALLDVDPHYQLTYDEASRCEPWAVALQKGYGGWRLAMKYLERTIKAEPGSPTAYFNLSDSYYFMGIRDSAYMLIKQGLRVNPNDFQKLQNASTVAQELNRFNEAAMWAEQAVRLEPNDLAALNRLGLALAFVGRAKEGLVYARRAYKLAPEKYEQIANMGIVLAASGAADSALYYLQRAVPVSPAEKRAYVFFCMANLCIDMGRIEEAADYADTVRSIEPDSPNFKQLADRLSAVSKP